VRFFEIRMRIPLSTLLVPALLCTLAGQGFCQDGSKPAGQSTWYGKQILLSDGLSYTALFVAIPTGSVALGAIGGLSYLIAPPVIHGVHHHRGRAFLSVIMRIGFPLVGGIIGDSMANCHAPPPGVYDEDNGFCGLGETLVGIGIGMAAATALDASLAWDSPTAAPPAVLPPRDVQTHYSLIRLTAAGVAPSSNGAKLVFGGQF